MKPATADAWAWILIYGGLIIAGLAWFLRPAETALAGILIGIGAVAAIAGIVLVIVRSRMPPSKERP